MKITKIYLKNFKRFTELTIEGIPVDTKLVMLVGPNGCGKSSIFDAFEYLISGKKGHSRGEETDYHRKDLSQPVHIGIWNEKTEEQSTSSNNLEKVAFYIRSPYRYASEIKINQINSLPPLDQDDDRPRRQIDVDNRLIRNYQRFIVDPVSQLYKGLLDNLLGKQIREKYIKEINDLLKSILKDIEISDIGDPLDAQRNQIYFSKGTVKNFPFKNLGSGEKEIVDLIIDFVMKKQVFNNTVYCVDEPDLHISTAIQSELLRGLLKILPDNSQLWISTHSLGFIQAAFELENTVIIDFSEKNFDVSQTLKPLEKIKENLRKTYRVALENLVDFVIAQRIIFCEGENKDSDEKLYKLIFDEDQDFKETEFISSKSGLQVKAAVLSVLEPINRGLSPKKVLAIIDRDYRTEDLIEEDRGDYIKILNYYSLENYLLDPENIKNFKEIDPENYRIFLIKTINENLKKLKEKIKRTLTYIDKRKNGSHIRREIEAKNELLKADIIDDENFQKIYPFIPTKELLGNIVDWYNKSYRNNREQYSPEKFLEELAQVFGSNKNSVSYKNLKRIIVS